MRMTGGQVVVEMLRALQVRYLFGVPGDTSLAFYDALCTHQDAPRHILARDELSAAGMSQAELEALVMQAVESRWLWVLGEARVNVLNLNMALDRVQ